MSKNSELFINMCNFMVYMINDILPELESTEPVETAFDNLLLAITKYKKESQSFPSDKKTLKDQQGYNYSSTLVSRKDGSEARDDTLKNNIYKEKVNITAKPSSTYTTTIFYPKTGLAKDVSKQSVTLLRKSCSSLNPLSNKTTMQSSNRNSVPNTCISSSPKDPNDIQARKNDLRRNIQSLIDLKAAETHCDSKRINAQCQNLPVTHAESSTNSPGEGRKTIRQRCDKPAEKVTSNISSPKCFNDLCEDVPVSNAVSSTNSSGDEKNNILHRFDKPAEKASSNFSSPKDSNDQCQNLPVSCAVISTNSSGDDKNNIGQKCGKPLEKVSSNISSPKGSNDQCQNSPVLCAVSSSNSSGDEQKNVLHKSKDPAFNVSSNILSPIESLISYEICDTSFEENFLKFYSDCFLDSEPSSENIIVLNNEETGNVAKTEPLLPHDVNSFSEPIADLKLFDVDSKYSLSYLKSLNPMGDSVPLGFQSINNCFQSKLLRDAFYCSQCDMSVENRIGLEEHMNDWELHKSKWKEETFNISRICNNCSFFVLASNSKMNVLIDYHNQTHESSSLNCQINHQYIGLLQENLATFVKRMLRMKHMRENNATASYLGICLICKHAFPSPLEWNHHLYEFHNNLATQKYHTCALCCLVILGDVNNFEFRQLMKISDRLCNCPLSSNYS